MFNLIVNEETLKSFFTNILYPLENDEVFFVSLSGRKKYLSEDERQIYDLGRTEMFERRIIREYNWDRFKRTIYKFNASSSAYVTKDGKSIPQKCLSVYVNINPSSTLKTLKDFNNKMNEYQYELSQCIMNNRPIDNIISRIKKADRLLMTAYQRNRSRKIWLDIDFDIPHKNFDVVQHFINEIEENGVRYVIVKTHSGFHVLMDRRTLNYNFNTSLQKTIMFSKDVMSIDDFGEIVVNKNEMIPLPGTLHADFPVHFLNRKGERLP